MSLNDTKIRSIKPLAKPFTLSESTTPAFRGNYRGTVLLTKRDRIDMCDPASSVELDQVL
ncbi:hypothetical protein EZJ58_0844 [Sodalis ligni]|uniref:Uncharacterized protein n=1 Tax=Sodalis ligni TaxID=2697027 RepID=A0A4V2Q2G7_9GAMM|nr:hypothetical protein EZJ58_0844 [Sodalis ligni]